MNLVLNVPRPVAARIEEEAQRAGISPAALLTSVVLEKFAPPPLDVESQKRLNAPSIALMEQWLRQSETEDPDELREAEEEARQFKRDMNAPRKEVGARLLFPEAETAE